MTKKDLNVLMIASECGEIAKVGGLADVVIDLTGSLVKKGIKASIILPYYEVIKIKAEKIFDLEIEFANRSWIIFVYRHIVDGIPVYLIKNDFFFSGEYKEIYIDSDRLERGPFEDDAKRFAFFSKAVFDLLTDFEEFKDVNVLHCHDWHTGSLLFLLKYNNEQLRNKYRIIFTIHNLDYQGIRPFNLKSKGNFSSFSEWFPDSYKFLKNSDLIDDLKDPNIKLACFNPMKAGINLADMVNTVSPTYAEEITKSDDEYSHFIGGRGLESDLQRLKSEKKLTGILNGLDYEVYDPNKLSPSYDSEKDHLIHTKIIHKENFLSRLTENIESIEGNFPNKKAVLSKLKSFKGEDWTDIPMFITVSRIVSQKVGILFENYSDDGTLLDRIMDKKLFYVVIGRGDMQDQMKKLNDYDNGLFINAFASGFAKNLYPAGDVFLMPSDFEPCGISQMIAMRYGCLPLAHDIGGLHDTVRNLETGFLYSGTNRDAARYALLQTVDKTVYYYNYEKAKWLDMQSAAMKSRFLWEKSADEYLKVYLE
jgi:starch synthase